MRIQEVMGKTGLSRRTIHYYIDQKLIIPPVNEAMGIMILQGRMYRSFLLSESCGGGAFSCGYPCNSA